MKPIKLEHHLAEQVFAGTKTSTWRLFDDKDLTVGDKIDLIDKVNPDDPSSWRGVGVAIILRVIEKPLGEITEADMEGHEPFESKQQMIDTYRGYYGDKVSEATPVKIVHFRLVD